jgi:hypothetical protein
MTLHAPLTQEWETPFRSQITDVLPNSLAGPSKQATMRQRNRQQLAATKTVMELLATSFLAPPQSAHRAVISIMANDNRCGYITLHYIKLHAPLNQEW